MRVIYVENVNESDNKFYHKLCQNKAHEIEKEKAKKLLLSELKTDEDDEKYSSEFNQKN